MTARGPGRGVPAYGAAATPSPRPAIAGTSAITSATILGGRAGMVRTAIIIAVTIAILASLLYWIGTTDILGAMRLLTPGHILAVLGLTLILPIAHALRLQVALASADSRLGFWRSLELTMGVWPISSLTPAKSGDLMKAYYLRDQIAPTVTTGALLAERAVDLAVWGALSLVASVLVYQPVTAVFSAAVFGGIMVALFVFAPRVERLPVSGKWRDRARLLLASTRGLARRPMLLLALAGLTLVNCLATVLVTAILYAGVGADVPLPAVAASVLPAMFAGLLPFTLAGMGTRDSVMIALFAPYASRAQSLSVGLLYAFFFRWLLSLLGLPFLRRLVNEGTPDA